MYLNQKERESNENNSSALPRPWSTAILHLFFLQKQTLLPDYLCVLPETFYSRVGKHTHASMCIYLSVYVYGICVFPPCLFLQMGFYKHDSEGYILYSIAYLGHHCQNV